MRFRWLAVAMACALATTLAACGSDKKSSGKFSYGAPPENRTRYQGLVGMEKAYGLKNIDFKPLRIGLQYKALDSGKIDTAAVFTTDAQLATGKYKVLKDSKAIFGFQNVAPVVNTKKLAKLGPAFSSTLNAVSAKLTNEAMIKMNGAVDLDKKKPAVVAKAFLQANGLLASGSGGKGKPAITLGDKDFTEQYILGELYAQALRAKGYTVKIKSNIGSSEITDKALTSGQLDMYPEYMGVITTVLAKLSDMPASAQETYDKAKAFETKRGFTLLTRTPFFNADGVAVKPDFAAKFKLEDLGDLKNVK